MPKPTGQHAGSGSLDPGLQERIHRLWDELAGFEAARSDEALMYLLENVATLVDAQNAYWMGAVRLTDDERDPLRGWRPRVLRYLHPVRQDEALARRMRAIKSGAPDEAAVAHARRAGTFRACRMCDLVSPEWFKSPAYQVYQARNIHDSLVVGVPVSTTVEAYYGFLRMRKNDPFSEAQRDIAFYAMRGLTWLHRQLLLAHGVQAASSALSPTERRVLALLLTDRSEKLIAADLGVTPATVHTYIRTVLRKLGVSGRNGLISLWLGRQAG